ncbi:MAG: hypothetical protein ABI777_13155, partial [Betaproteobacteria bacterium]
MILSPDRSARLRLTVIVALATSVAVLQGCGKDAPKAPDKGPINVTTMAIERKDVPVTAVYVAQT